jgi:hypothetical protein
LVEGVVRAMVVEVRHVLGQHRRKMPAVDDQHPVEQFTADSSDPSFGDPVRLGLSGQSKIGSAFGPG